MAVAARIAHVANRRKDLESVYMTNAQLVAVLSKNADQHRGDEQVFTILDVDFVANDVPGSGYRTWWLKPSCQEPATAAGVWLCDGGMENKWLRVRFRADGTLDLHDKCTNHTFFGLNYFVDREDVGDTYDYHALPDSSHMEDSRAYVAEWHLTSAYAHCITYQATVRWTLPQCVEESGQRSERRRAMPLTLYATLYADIAHLEMVVEVENVCEDHCLRMVLDTGLRTETVAAYDHFQVLERPVHSLLQEEWRDEPFQEFVDVSDGAHGLCLTTRGLPAYQAFTGERGTRLYLTLLRAVGQMGPAAGANYAAPGAQCPGFQRFNYALIPHAGSWLEGDCLGAASDYRTSLLVEADEPHAGTLPAAASLFNLTCSGSLEPFRSCLKPAEKEGGAIVLRLWNPEGEQVVGLESFIPLKNIAVAALDESVTAEIGTDRTSVTLQARGLTTILVTPE
jgi:alpha-mannosidase